MGQAAPGIEQVEVGAVNAAANRPLYASHGIVLRHPVNIGG